MPDKLVKATRKESFLDNHAESRAADDMESQCMLILLRHPLLCRFYNRLLSIVNFVLDFPLRRVIPSILSLLTKALLVGAAALEASGRTQKECRAPCREGFESVCRAYADGLIPLLAVQLKSAFFGKTKPGVSRDLEIAR